MLRKPGIKNKFVLINHNLGASERSLCIKSKLQFAFKCVVYKQRKKKSVLIEKQKQKPISIEIIAHNVYVDLFLSIKLELARVGKRS
jgi:hypothetical protein